MARTRRKEVEKENWESKREEKGAVLLSHFIIYPFVL